MNKILNAIAKGFIDELKQPIFLEKGGEYGDDGYISEIVSRKPICVTYILDEQTEKRANVLMWRHLDVMVFAMGKDFHLYPVKPCTFLVVRLDLVWETLCREAGYSKTSFPMFSKNGVLMNSIDSDLLMLHIEETIKASSSVGIPLGIRNKTAFRHGYIPDHEYHEAFDKSMSKVQERYHEKQKEKSWLEKLSQVT